MLLCGFRTKTVTTFFFGILIKKKKTKKKNMRFFFPKLYKTLNVHTKGKEKKMYVSPFYKGVVHVKVFF
jgi:hypothetical protein